ncbi:MAG: hypothetical protein ACYS32_02495 [Planctomycetota bacterium]|jgi:preprotein translocase subunit SecG
MLSFLRDQGFEDSLDSQTPQTPNGEAKRQENAPADNNQQQQYLTVVAQGKNVRKMTTILVVLFAIGLVGLLFMIKKSAPKTATASSENTEENQIEKAIERLTGVGSEMFKRMDQIVNKFYEFSDVKQVGVNELTKNPFEHQIFLADLGETTDSKDDEMRAELIRKQRLKQGTKDMQLLTICQTDQGNCCMIDSKILYEGDMIKGYKVGHISDDSVKLELEGVEIVLKLSNDE